MCGVCCVQACGITLGCVPWRSMCSFLLCTTTYPTSPKLLLNAPTSLLPASLPYYYYPSLYYLLLALLLPMSPLFLPSYTTYYPHTMPHCLAVRAVLACLQHWQRLPSWCGFFCLHYYYLPAAWFLPCHPTCHAPQRPPTCHAACNIYLPIPCHLYHPSPRAFPTTSPCHLVCLRIAYTCLLPVVLIPNIHTLPSSACTHNILHPTHTPAHLHHPTTHTTTAHFTPLPSGFHV